MDKDTCDKFQAWPPWGPRLIQPDGVFLSPNKQLITVVLPCITISLGGLKLLHKVQSSEVCWDHQEQVKVFIRRVKMSARSSLGLIYQHSCGGRGASPTFRYHQNGYIQHSGDHLPCHQQCLCWLDWFLRSWGKMTHSDTWRSSSSVSGRRKDGDGVKKTISELGNLSSNVWIFALILMWSEECDQRQAAHAGHLMTVPWRGSWCHHNHHILTISTIATFPTCNYSHSPVWAVKPLMQIRPEFRWAALEWDESGVRAQEMWDTGSWQGEL